LAEALEKGLTTAKAKEDKQNRKAAKKRKLQDSEFGDWTKKERSEFQGLLQTWALPPLPAHLAHSQAHLDQRWAQIIEKGELQRESEDLEEMFKMLMEQMEYIKEHGPGDDDSEFTEGQTQKGAKRFVERVGLLDDIKNEVLGHRNRIEGLKSCKAAGSNFPSVWGFNHDLGLLKGVVKHGFGKWNEIFKDDDLGLREVKNFPREEKNRKALLTRIRALRDASKEHGEKDDPNDLLYNDETIPPVVVTAPVGRLRIIVKMEGVDEVMRAFIVRKRKRLRKKFAEKLEDAEEVDAQYSEPEEGELAEEGEIVEMPGTQAAPPKHDDRIPKKDDTDRIPKKGDFDRIPKKGDFDRIPKKDDFDRIPKKDDFDRIPKKGDSDRIPRKDDTFRIPKKEAMPRKLMDKIPRKQNLDLGDKGRDLGGGPRYRQDSEDDDDGGDDDDDEDYDTGHKKKRMRLS